MERPDISKDLDNKIFRSFYYLKEELVDFCKKNGLPTSGGKIELTDRIANFLETGEVKPVNKKDKKVNLTTKPLNRMLVNSKQGISNGDTITLSSPIEENYVCSEDRRAFFKEHIGKQFSLMIIRENHWRMLLNAGNIRNSYKGITVMKRQT